MVNEPTAEPTLPTKAPVARKSQATSCAECRRLKLKCDRVFPCASCIRRGCANLCPSGTLEKGRRGFLKRLEQSLPSPAPQRPGENDTHVVSSEVAMFVDRDAAMSRRIQELESALTSAGIPIPGVPSTSQPRLGAGSSKRPRSSSLDIEYDKRSSNIVPPAVTPSVLASVSEETPDAALGFGALMISLENRSKYIGLSGASAYLDADFWKMNHEPGGAPDPKPTSFSEAESKIISKMNCLPTETEACRLAEAYFANGSFMYEIIPRYIFFAYHLPAVYPTASDEAKPLKFHVLSLVSMVLALGSFFDLSLPIQSVVGRATELYELGLASLNADTHKDGAFKLDTISAVQTVHLMALYHLSTKGEAGGEPAWQLLGLAVRSIQAQGCHRDGSRCGLPLQELEERRRVFWETHTYDRLQSFTFGRPYALNDQHYDCEMPQSCDTPLPSDTDPSDSTFSHTRWHHHKFRFAILLGRIVDLAFGVKTPTYAVIVQLDREITQFYLELPAWILCHSVTHPVQELPDAPAGSPMDTRKHSQIYSFANMIFLTILHLHRGPFCRALMLGPNEMLKSQYAASVGSLTGAARAIINIARGMFALHPGIACRMWYWIFHAFTAAVCQAVLVIVAPFHPLAPLAFESMNAAIELFDKADGDRARFAAERVKALAAKAQYNMGAYRNASQATPGGSSNQRSGSEQPISLPGLDEDVGRVQFPESNIRGDPKDLLGASTKLVRPWHEKAPHLPALTVPSNPYQATETDRAAPLLYDPGHSAAPWSMPLHEAEFTNFLDWRVFRDSDTRIDTCPDFNVDGFNLTSFIQSGADAWMLDSAMPTDAHKGDSTTQPWVGNSGV